MNILLFTGYSGFSRRNHSLFSLVKKKYINSNIDVITFGKQNFEFLLSRKSIYRNIFCADDLRLQCLKDNYKLKYSAKYWEEKLDVNLSKIALSERLFVHHSHDLIYLKPLSQTEIINHTLSLFEIYEEIVKECDIIYIYTPASIETEILYLLSSFYNKKFFCYYECRLGYNFILSDNTKDVHGKLSEIYKDLDDNEIFENELYINFINQVKASKKTLQQELHFKKLKNSKNFNFINSFRFICNLLVNESPHYLGPSRLQRIKTNILLKYRKSILPKLTENYLPDSRFVYFPLPTVPEASTLIRSPLFYDCLSLIKSLSIELPFDWKIVVKEHPGMLGKRTKEFYKNISKIYNVHLLDTNFPTDHIIKNSQAVITQTGTTAMESIARGIKTITLGSTITNIINGVFSLTYVSEVGAVLRSPWTSEDSNNLTTELKRFALAVERYGYVRDDETVLWTQRAFNPEIIELDRRFFVDFDNKVLSKINH